MYEPTNEEMQMMFADYFAKCLTKQIEENRTGRVVLMSKGEYVDTLRWFTTSDGDRNVYICHSNGGFYATIGINNPEIRVYNDEPTVVVSSRTEADFIHIKFEMIDDWEF